MTIIWSLLLDLAYLAVAPFVFLYLLIASRGFTSQKIRRGIISKLWKTPCREGSSKSFWIHAVSVGEVITAIPLIERLRQAYPDWDLRVSVSTFTGYKVANDRLSDVTVFYSPMDLSFVVARFLKRHRPTAVILLELELWPNFLLGARRRGIPVLVANGRITERSARRYAYAGWLTRGLFNLVTSFGAQNEVYKERFLKVGVGPERVEVLGNLKHDREPSPAALKGEATRKLLGWEGPQSVVLVGGSTHPDEERILCTVTARLREGNPGLRLVLAPRHVERLDDAELARWRAAAPLCRWSKVREEGEMPVSEADGASILLVDTLGELEMFYSLADMVFVGGSLIPHGGQNLFEPARLGKPILFGPHYHNFQEEGDLLLREGGGILVTGVDDLQSRLEGLLSTPADRQQVGATALDVTRRLKGATDRHAEWIGRHLHLYLTGFPC